MAEAIRPKGVPNNTTRTSDEIRAKVADEYKNGILPGVIAKKYGVSTNTVNTIRAEAGIPSQRAESVKNNTAGKNLAFRQLVSNAKLRNIEFDLTKQLHEEVTQSACVYCGEPGCKHIKVNQGDGIDINGTDRIDSSLGYVQGNVLPCCTKCNRAKNDMNVLEFLQHTRQMHEHILKQGWYNMLDNGASLEKMIGALKNYFEEQRKALRQKNGEIIVDSSGQ